jgi:hypothetical protein
MLAGTDEYLVSCCGWGGERVTAIQTVDAEEFELRSCLDYRYISSFADKVEFAVG